MKQVKCKHIRTKDANYDVDVEKYINILEKQFKINFKTLPNWKDLIRKMKFTTTYYERKVQEVYLREVFIINKLYNEYFRPSPFVLTDQLSRTANIWQKNHQINQKCHKKYYDSGIAPEPSIQNSIDKENTEDLSLTKVKTSPEDILNDIKENDEKQTNSNISIVATNLNNRNSLSPYEPQSDDLSCYSTSSLNFNEKIEYKDKEIECLGFNLIKCYPKKLLISSDNFEKQCIDFSLKNVSSYCITVIFKNITNRKAFKKATVLPNVTIKLFPGLSKAFKFIFMLFQTKVDFSTSLLFRVQYKVPGDIVLTKLEIPIMAKFAKPIVITVTKEIIIEPVYEWHLNFKSRHPYGTLMVENKNINECFLRIVKRKNYFLEDTSFISIKAISPSTGSFIDRIENEESMNTWCTSICTVKNPNEEESNEEFILFVIQDVIETALDIFIFDRNYLLLPANSKQNISIIFNKSENIGHHQRLYDLEFHDLNSDAVIKTESFKVYAEILPHPIKINPIILDMSKSEIVHGVRTDYFFINNIHRIYTTNIKIKTTDVMKKLISITPVVASVLPKLGVKFNVTMCNSYFPIDIESKDMVHFTIEIIASGVSSVFDRIKPIYYEIIVPCWTEFQKICDSKIHVNNVHLTNKTAIDPII